jgi:hypothetical protein
MGTSWPLRPSSQSTIRHGVISTKSFSTGSFATLQTPLLRTLTSRSLAVVIGSLGTLGVRENSSPDLSRHSYCSSASGIANGAGSRDQESIGEAVNGYYGALLWATVTDDKDMANYARLLVATEQQAAQVYWHLYPNEDGNARDQPYPEQGVFTPRLSLAGRPSYPPTDFRKLVTVGNVEDFQAGAWL